MLNPFFSYSLNAKLWIFFHLPLFCIFDSLSSSYLIVKSITLLLFVLALSNVALLKCFRRYFHIFDNFNAFRIELVQFFILSFYLSLSLFLPFSFLYPLTFLGVKRYYIINIKPQHRNTCTCTLYHLEYFFFYFFFLFCGYLAIQLLARGTPIMIIAFRRSNSISANKLINKVHTFERFFSNSL